MHVSEEHETAGEGWMKGTYNREYEGRSLGRSGKMSKARKKARRKKRRSEKVEFSSLPLRQQASASIAETDTEARSRDRLSKL